MTVVPFPPRVHEPARTLEELRARKRSTHPSCDVMLTKDTRARRYTLMSDAPGWFIGEVWFGRCLHRRKRVAGVASAHTLLHQFLRELRDLIVDGWQTP